MKPWTVLVYLAGDNGRFLSSLEGEGVSDLQEMKQVGSGDAADVVAQFDAMSDRTCRRYHLSPGDNLSRDIVQDLGATNSGDAQVLIDFITWGVRTYPAEHYLLVLWNHGSGWRDEDVYAPYRALRRRGGLPPTPPQIAGRRVSRSLFRRSLEAIVEEEANQVILRTQRGGLEQRRGQEAGPLALEVPLPPGWLRPTPAPPPVVRGGRLPEPAVVTAMRSHRPPHPRAICFDDSSKDFLDSRELTLVLRAAVTEIGRKIDVLGMDACMMNMLEVAYQVRDGAVVMVGSEDAEPSSGWPYADILQALSANPTISAAELGKAITAAYVRSYDLDFLNGTAVTQSAIDLQQVAEAVVAVDELARGLLNAWRQKGVRTAVAEARAQTQVFMDPDYVDLFDFVSLLARKPGAKALQEICQRLLSVVEPGRPGGLVLADGHAGLVERNAHGLSIYFPMIGVSPFYAALDMSNDCSWARFLDTCLG